MRIKCQSCGKRLSMARLAAMPLALKCVPCTAKDGDVETYKEPPLVSVFYDKSKFGKALKKLSEHYGNGRMAPRN